MNPETLNKIMYHDFCLLNPFKGTIKLKCDQCNFSRIKNHLKYTDESLDRIQYTFLL